MITTISLTVWITGIVFCAAIFWLFHEDFSIRNILTCVFWPVVLVVTIFDHLRGK